MALSPDDRKARILQAMAASIQRKPSPYDPLNPVSGAEPLGEKSGTSGMLEPPRDQPSKPVVKAPTVNPVSDPTAGINPIEVPNTPPSQPSVRIGYSSAGLTGVDKLLQQKRAMEEADPESSVKTTGDFTEIAPPMPRHGVKGKLKSIGEGILTGLAMADPDNPNAILGSAIGGGSLGVATNRGEAKLKRRFDTNALDNDIARGLKLEGEQAQVGNLKAIQKQHEDAPTDQEKFDEATRIANAQLKVEEDRNKGIITDKEADRKQKELDRQSREKTNTATNEARIKAAEITAGGRSDTRSDKQAERDAKREAAQGEYDQLVSDEQKAGEEKNRAYAYLEQVKKTVPDDELGHKDVQQAIDAAQAADKLYQSFGEKKRDAQTRIRENTVTPKFKGTENLKGKKWFKSKFAAANPNADVEAAAAAAAEAGAEVVE